jgi:phage terminase large subunit-like protein
MRKRNKFFMIEELKADVDKERRIKGLQPRYACGSIYHKANMGELEEELLLFPKSPHDDIADALAYVPQIGFVSVGSSKLEGDKPSARTGETTMVDIKSLY